MPSRARLWRNPDLRAIVVLALLWLLFFWRLFTPSAADQASLAKGDFSGQFVAFAGYQYQRMSQGEIPLWNPYNNGGMPFIADTQAAVFYPPRWITLALSALAGAWSYNALQLEMAFHALAYSVLMYLFVRRLTWARPHSTLAALISAIVIAYGGYATSYPPLQLAILEAAIWFPLAALGILEATRRRNLAWRWLALAGFGLGMSWLAGHPQTSWFMTYLLVAYFAWRAYQQRIRARVIHLGIGHLRAGHIWRLRRDAAAGPRVSAADRSRWTGLRRQRQWLPIQRHPAIRFPRRPQLVVALVCRSSRAVFRRRRRDAQRRRKPLLADCRSGRLDPQPGREFVTLRPHLQSSAWIEVLSRTRASRFRGGQQPGHTRWSRHRRPSQLGNQVHQQRALAWWRRFAAALVVIAMAGFVLWLGDRDTWAATLDIAVRASLLALASVLVLTAFTHHPGRALFQIALVTLIVFDLFTVTQDHPGTYDSRPHSEQLSMAAPPLIQAVLQDDNGGQPFRVDGFRGLRDNFGSLYGIMDMRGISPLFLAGPQRIIYRDYQDNPLAWELFAVKYVFSPREALTVPSISDCQRR